MLPGFRFLFAAIVLSMSVLIFGLGAAALLRAAHEEFASIPSRRPPPEIMFAQQSDAQPTLAILRVEPAAVDEPAAKPASDNAPVAAPVEQPAIASNTPDEPAAEPDTTAALTDAATSAESAPPSETPKSETSASEIPVQAEVATDAPAPAVETKVAAIAETAEAPSQTAVAAPERENAPIDDSTRIAETKIATLGGPPVTIETQAPSKLAPAVVKKSVQAKRVVKRRRIAQRARVARPVPQRPANPFGTPFGS
jgi:outer membrane biosynthesis protein TonB